MSLPAVPGGRCPCGRPDEHRGRCAPRSSGAAERARAAYWAQAGARPPRRAHRSRPPTASPAAPAACPACAALQHEVARLRARLEALREGAEAPAGVLRAIDALHTAAIDFAAAYVRWREAGHRLPLTAAVAVDGPAEPDARPLADLLLPHARG